MPNRVVEEDHAVHNGISLSSLYHLQIAERENLCSILVNHL